MAEASLHSHSQWAAGSTPPGSQVIAVVHCHWIHSSAVKSIPGSPSSGLAVCLGMPPTFPMSSTLPQHTPLPLRPEWTPLKAASMAPLPGEAAIRFFSPFTAQLLQAQEVGLVFFISHCCISVFLLERPGIFDNRSPLFPFHQGPSPAPSPGSHSPKKLVPSGFHHSVLLSTFG